MSDAKNPRDWLLVRHAPATHRLEEARRAAVPAPDISWREFLRELIRPHRTVWRALAFVWLGLLLFHFTLGRALRPTPAPLPTAEAAAAWLTQLKSNETFAQIDSRP